jgi:hypothetical protein
MVKQKRIVVLRYFNPEGCGDIPKMTKNNGYELVRSFWRNGEGWYTVRDEKGIKYTAPDVFFDTNGAFN